MVPRVPKVPAVLKTFVVLAALGFAHASFAQPGGGFAMPDMKQMSGIPRPVTDLPDRAVSVRVIRGDLSNNIANHPVQLRVGSKTLTEKTDASGRAEFKDLPAGEPVTASTDVDGEHLESQQFPAPQSGGVRLMLVATDKSKAPATEPDAQPVSGQVVIGNESRIVMQPTEEAIDVYYLLDISNTARVPVNPPKMFAFDLPVGAQGAAIMEGSSPLATLAKNRLAIAGPFPPGQTFVQVAYELPATDGNANVSQVFPANIEQFGVVVKKVGATAVTSPQITAKREMPADGEMYIAGQGAAVPAGQVVQLNVTGIPHHSAAPRWIALALAVAIIGIGAWAATTPEDDKAAAAAERKRLVAKRDKLLSELVRLQHDRTKGRVDDRRYTFRREELVVSLEQIYGALDNDDADPAAA
jgi:hypothetical protein